MATQTGSIDLTATNAVKLAAEASVDNKLTNYATHAQLELSAGNIKSEVAETYATKSEAQPTNTGSGTVVSSDDAANLPPLSLTVHGKSVQDGTPSPSSPVGIKSVEAPNLAPFFSVPFDDFYNAGTNPDGYWNGLSGGITDCTTQLADGWVHVEFDNTSGTGTRWMNFNAVPDLTLKTNTSYMFIIEVRDLVTTLNSSNQGATIVACSGNSDVLKGQFNGTVSSGKLTKDTVSLSVATSRSSFDGCATRFRSFLEFVAGCKASFDCRISVYETSNYAAYSRFGAISVNTSGRNIFGGPYINSAINTTTGAITASNTYNYTSRMMYVTNSAATVMVEDKGEYGGSINFACYASDGAFLGFCQPLYFGGMTVPYRHKMNLLTNTASIIATGYYASGAALLNTAKVAIYDGDVDYPYEPYSPVDIPIPLQGNAARSVPDGTEDTLEVDGEGNVTLTQRVGIVTYDGSNDETWYVANNGASVYIFNNDCAIQSSNIETFDGMCDRFAPLTPNQTWAGNLVGFSSNTGTNHILRFTDGTKAMTVDGWKTWLQSNPVTVLYPLAEPQTISLGKIDLPALPSPSFSLHVDALVTPTIDAEWWTMNGYETGSVTYRASTLEQDVNGLTMQMQGKVDSDEEWVSWMHAGTDPTTHEPYLAMGQDSDYPSVVYGGSAAKFYDGEGDDASNVVASFGADGVVVGKDGSANTTISDSDIVFHDADGNQAGKISMSSEGAVPASASHTITANTSQQSYTLDGLAPLPDFTLGNLVVDLLVNGTVVRKYNYTSISEAEFSVSIDTLTDATFTAAQSGDTWGATMTAQYRVQGATADITFSLSWVYRGTAPMYEFGTTENTGAYSFSAGTGLVAAGQSQAVFGTYNIPSQTDLFILGNGTSNVNRSNALKVDSQGTLETNGYFQSGGVVGLGADAQQGWLSALGPFMRFAEVTTATQSISAGSVGYFSVAAPTYTGYTLRGAIQAWDSGSGTVIIGGSYRSSSDNNMHFVVRANNSASVAIKALLLYTLNAITS